jgi:hypothetical protein
MFDTADVEFMKMTCACHCMCGQKSVHIVYLLGSHLDSENGSSVLLLNIG